MSSFDLALISGLTWLLGVFYSISSNSDLRDLKRMIKQYPELMVAAHVKSAMRNSRILYWVGIVMIVLACVGLSVVVVSLWW